MFYFYCFIPYNHRMKEVHFFYVNRRLQSYPRIHSRLYYELKSATTGGQRRNLDLISSITGRLQSVTIQSHLRNTIDNFYSLTIYSSIPKIVITATIVVESA